MMDLKEHLGMLEILSYPLLCTFQYSKLNSIKSKLKQCSHFSGRGVITGAISYYTLLIFIYCFNAVDTWFHFDTDEGLFIYFL